MIAAIIKLIPALLAFAGLVWAVRKIDWQVVGNRALHWIASAGTFMIFNQLGVQQLISDYIASISWTLKN